jgi:adenylate cyclase
MTTKRATVLVVDDSPINLHLAVNILKNDYRVKVANNGAAALELATASPPDLILLDVMMPEMDGFEVCRRLKANPATSLIPVVFLTSRTEEEDEKMGFLVGATDFIHKPFSPLLVALRVKTQLEIKFLQDLLRNQSEEERNQKAQLMRIFCRHVSDEVAEEMWRERAQFLSGNRPRPQLLTATVMFADIRGFTSISERLAPEVLFDWLNEYMEAMSKIVSAHRGMINKYIGDAVMVVFGTPIPRTTQEEIAEDAMRATDCALAMREALKTLNTDFAKRGLPEVEIRVGIFTGSLTAGTLGSSQRLEYTVIGDTVNMASRLEQIKELESAGMEDVPCRVLIGESTCRLLGTAYRTRALQPVLLRGKAEPIPIFVLEGRDESHARPASA